MLKFSMLPPKKRAKTSQVPVCTTLSETQGTYSILKASACPDLLWRKNIQLGNVFIHLCIHNFSV